MKYCTLCKEKYEDTITFCPVDGEVLEGDPASIVNTVLDGQYQMEALLGKGGMGAVYRARHILLGDRVAIKVLPPEVRTNAEWLRRFRREGQAARRFRHSNAVTVYDLRTAADGTIYMVMEYVEGHTLDHKHFVAANTYHVNGLVELARKENDYITINFLQWFLTEQLEEVSSMDNLLKIIERAGTDLLQADEYLARVGLRTMPEPPKQ